MMKRSRSRRKAPWITLFMLISVMTRTVGGKPSRGDTSNISVKRTSVDRSQPGREAAGRSKAGATCECSRGSRLRFGGGQGPRQSGLTDAVAIEGAIPDGVCAWTLTAAVPHTARNTVDLRACRAPNGDVMTLRAVVLVEGDSDRVALHTLADRSGRDLAAEGIDVVAMGGITNTRAFASHYGPRGLGVALAGLYDAPEEAKLRHGLAAAGLGAALEPGGITGLGFYMCSVDLEDELIRALGVEAVEAVIEAEGEARSLRLLAGMPAQRGWRREAVLRRFLGVRSGRKARYAELLVDALEPGRVPEPLAAVLARI